jgi:hypothetical protein
MATSRIPLVCGHIASRVRKKDHVGYCSTCQEWQWLNAQPSEIRSTDRRGVYDFEPDPDRLNRAPR